MLVLPLQTHSRQSEDGADDSNVLQEVQHLARKLTKRPRVRQPLAQLKTNNG